MPVIFSFFKYFLEYLSSCIPGEPIIKILSSWHSLESIICLIKLDIYFLNQDRLLIHKNETLFLILVKLNLLAALKFYNFWLNKIYLDHK